MATVTVSITPNSVGNASVGYLPNAGSYLSLGTALSVNGLMELLLGLLTLNRSNGTVDIRLVASQTETPVIPGPEFSMQMEMNGSITIEASNGDTLVLSGISDSTEPYAWLPSNAADVIAFADTVAGLSDRLLIVTFNDNPVVEQLFTKVGGVWLPTTVYTKVSGSWVEAKVYSKQAGAWVQVNGPA